MFNTIKRLLRDQGGWMAAIPLATSLISGIMNNQKKGGPSQTSQSKTYTQFGMENLEPFVHQEKLNALDSTKQLGEGMAAAKAGGLMPAISEAFSQRPNSAQYDAIASQERNLKNEALNTGARGGLLKKQMFEAAKNAASNKLNVMENARQNALQRAFQIFQPQAPTQASSVAQYGVANQGLNMLGNVYGNAAQMAEQRKAAGAQASNASSSGLGEGLGSILGGMNLGGLFGGGSGSSTPAFTLGGATGYEGGFF